MGSTVGGVCDGGIGVAAGCEKDGVGLVVGVVCNGVPLDGVVAALDALDVLVPAAARLFGDE